MNRAVLGIGGAAALLASPAGGEPVVLTPTSDWLVNYADDSCRLGRVFSEGEARTVLMMDRFAPSDSFQLAVASKLLTRTMARDQGSREVTIRFGPGEAEQSEPMMPATVDNLPALLGNEVMLGVRADETAHQAELAAAKAAGDKAKIKALEVLVPAMPMTPEREASVTYLEIRGAAKDPITLKLGKMDKPMAALRTCIDELLTHWGVDPEAHRR